MKFIQIDTPAGYYGQFGAGSAGLTYFSFTGEPNDSEVDLESLAPILVSFRQRWNENDAQIHVREQVIDGLIAYDFDGAKFSESGRHLKTCLYVEFAFADSTESLQFRLAYC